MRTLRNWIGGAGQPAIGGATLETVDPATGETIGAVPASGEADIASAVAAAKEAFPAWSGRSAAERSEHLHALAAGIETAGRHADVIKSDLFEATVEETLSGPVFVLDYPASVCPLTKRKAGNPAVAERFELYVAGMELANAYTELNDPDLQEELFRTQLAGLPADESMARMDTDFIRALRHGMPPAGGLGVGIDRLVMFLTGAESIRDVVLFPILRPRAE